MNIYTLNSGINSKLGTVEDDVEALITSTGTLETDIETLVTSTGTLEDDIELLITAVDHLTVAAGTLTTAMVSTITDTEMLDQALAANDGTPEAVTSLTMTDVACTGAKIVAVQVNNKGDSTSVKVNIYGKIGSLAYANVPEITEVTLDASTAENDIITLLQGSPIVPYDEVKVVVSNADAANATTVDAVVRVIV